MRHLTHSQDFIQRFSEYTHSKEFTDVPLKSKSNYWKHYASLLQTRIEGDKLITSGSSGYYMPLEKSLAKKLNLAFYLLTHDFKKFKEIVRRRLGLVRAPIKMLSYRQAFDAVMAHDPLAGVVVTPRTVNYKKLKENPQVIQSVKDMESRFYGRSLFSINEHIISAYFYWNILNGYVDFSKVNRVLEIGAGNGNFSALLYFHLKNIKVIIVDLPETLCMSMAYIAHLFPQAKICMPHESASSLFSNADFVFLTPQQINLIEDNSIQLAVNTDSFQEMKPEQIEEYFKLIQRVCSPGGYFFTVNRVEKIPLAPGEEEMNAQVPVNRFSEYPWEAHNEDLVYEISRLLSLVQTEPVYIRLQRIVKS